MANEGGSTMGEASSIVDSLQSPSGLGTDNIKDEITDDTMDNSDDNSGGDDMEDAMDCDNDDDDDYDMDESIDDSRSDESSYSWNSDALSLYRTRRPEGINFMDKLTPKIRSRIYDFVFFSTRLTWGRRVTGEGISDFVEMKRPSRSLALLRTCKKIREEIGDSWIQKVLFNFEEPEDMLDILTAIPRETLSKVRHVRVRGNQMSLDYYERMGDGLTYDLTDLLELLPGLRLDRLTVLGIGDAGEDLSTLNTLIKGSNGWKELHHISQKSRILGYRRQGVYENGDYNYNHLPEPAHWNSLLMSRDEAYPDCSVTIYRAIIPDCLGAAIYPDTRETFKQLVPAQRIPGNQSARKSNMMMMRDMTMMRDEEVQKEVLVVVKRGTGADYEVKSDSPHHNNGYDLREALAGREWRDLRMAQVRDIPDDGQLYSYDGRFDDDSMVPWVTDVYSHVDDYVWTPFRYDRVDWPNLDF
ncbi:hypothetical protein F4776DRAFT_673821 [Hypoxylon sp. NC0597]|nr:hypothetical protein F4776DRAFT_673821 [Hypoxylon sp. NC0597]